MPSNPWLLKVDLYYLVILTTFGYLTGEKTETNFDRILVIDIFGFLLTLTWIPTRTKMSGVMSALTYDTFLLSSDVHETAVRLCVLYMYALSLLIFTERPPVHFI